MKFKKLLVLSALSLMGMNAWADVPDGVWSIPDPSASLEFTEFNVDDSGTHVYFYNPAAKMFFASGNDWNTRASIASFGYEMWCEPSTEADAPEGSYELWDDCQHPNRVLGYKNMFTDDGGSTWVDHADQPNYSWTVTKVGDAYRFQNVALVADKPEFDGKYMGWKGDYTDTKLYMLAEGEGAIDWKAVSYDSYQAFIASDSYAAYQNGVDCYSIAISLKAALEEAEGLGANIAAQLAVYSNTGSTKDELQKALDAIKLINDARKALKKGLDDAKAAGFGGTAPFDAVYANGDATEAELKKALEDLNAELVEWGKGHATVENPADMTVKIKNPHFDNGDCTTGWSGDAFGRGGTVSDGAEHYNKNYNTYQTIKGLTPGVYAVGVNGYYRSGNYGGTAEGHWAANDEASKFAKLYAKVGETTLETPIANVMSGGQAEAQNQGDMAVTYQDAEGNDVTVYVHNTMATGDYFMHTLNQYANKLYVGVGEEGELTIGVKKSSQIDGDWSMFDDFSLTYYGAGADAAQLYLDETIKNYSEKTIDEDVIYTESYLTAYNEALKGDFPTTSFAELAEALGALDEANKAIDKNIALWKQWQEDCAAAFNKYVLNDKYADFPEIDELADYSDADGGDYQDVIDAHDWTNEKLEEEIAHIAAMCEALDEALKNATHYDGDDMTDFIKNPGFDEDKDINSNKAEGWNIDITKSGGNIVRGPLGEDNQAKMEGALGYRNFCFEAWHGYTWDVWQEIENLPKGMYQLDVQGYVRCEVDGYTKGDELTDYPSPVYLYMNSATAQFPSVYSQSPEDIGQQMVEVESWYQETINDKQYPNSMGGASQCFGWGMYKMTTYGLVAKKGDKFRIGVRMNADQNWWCIWDNFKLTYREPSVEVVKPILEAELEKLDLSRPMGKNIFDQASQVKEAAAAALASGDGEQMFDALVAVYDLGEAINASVALFAQLNDANESLGMKLSSSKADEATKTEAKTLNNTINDGIENKTIEDSEVEGFMASIKTMKTKLGIPADYAEATDDNVKDFTGVIENPAYDEGIAGWAGTGAAWSGDGLNAEIFGKNYDYYQDIVGLPAGTYEVDVQAFYRAGTAAIDYETWTENPDLNNNGFLYAASILGGDTLVSSKPIVRLAAEAGSDFVDSEGYVTVKPASEAGDDGLAVPNNMNTASWEFDAGKYNNSVIVTLADGATLRIGLKKTTELTDNWTIFDNWQVKYFGANSSKTADSDPSGINAAVANAAVVEFFNLSGARISKPGKGVAVMKQTFRDGSVKIQKVTIK